MCKSLVRAVSAEPGQACFSRSTQWSVQQAWHRVAWVKRQSFCPGVFLLLLLCKAPSGMMHSTIPARYLICIATTVCIAQERNLSPLAHWTCQSMAHDSLQDPSLVHDHCVLCVAGHVSVSQDGRGWQSGHRGAKDRRGWQSCAAGHASVSKDGRSWQSGHRGTKDGRCYQPRHPGQPRHQARRPWQPW